MSWLATEAPLRTLADALALRPDLAAGLRALESAVAAEPSLDARLRARCRTRVAALFGATASGDGGRHPDGSRAESAASGGADGVVIDFVEQFVMDAQGVSDELVTRLGTVLPPRAIVALAQAVAVWEAEHRLARCLEVAPEL